MDRGTVFVVNLGMDYQYSDAEKRFGDLLYMTRGILDLRNLNKYREVITAYLENSNGEIDYLLLSGPGLVYSLALKIWFEFNTKCNILYYNSKQHAYDLYTVIDASPE